MKSTEHRAQSTEHRAQSTEHRAQITDHRINWIDFGKGLTVFMVVLGHVTLGLYESNRFESNNSWILLITQIFYLYHMPVFFALSGFFFKPSKDIRTLGRAMYQKLISFGIPYVFYSVLQFTLQQIGGDSVRNAATVSDLLNLWQQPIGVGWYLYILWWLYLVAGLLALVVKKVHAIFVVAIFLFLANLMFFPTVYLVYKISLWFICFAMGYWLRQTQFHLYLEKQWQLLTGFSLVVITGFLIWWQSTKPAFYVSYDTPGWSGLIFLVSVILAFSIYPVLDRLGAFGNYFRKLGKDSLVIYILHGSIVSVTRIALLKLGIDQIFLHIVIGLATGWFGPIMALYVLKKIPYLDFVFYPWKYIRQK